VTGSASLSGDKEQLDHPKPLPKTTRKTKPTEKRKKPKPAPAPLVRALAASDGGEDEDAADRLPTSVQAHSCARGCYRLDGNTHNGVRTVIRLNTYLCDMTIEAGHVRDAE
jgi:hypothetical protein